MAKRSRAGKLWTGLRTTAAIYGAVSGPMGGSAHKPRDAEYGYGRNVSGYSRDAERNRRGNDIRRGTNDRNNRKRGYSN